MILFIRCDVWLNCWATTFSCKTLCSYSDWLGIEACCTHIYRWNFEKNKQTRASHDITTSLHFSNVHIVLKMFCFCWFDSQPSRFESRPIDQADTQNVMWLRTLWVIIVLLLLREAKQGGTAGANRTERWRNACCEESAGKKRAVKLILAVKESAERNG